MPETSRGRGKERIDSELIAFLPAASGDSSIVQNAFAQADLDVYTVNSLDECADEIEQGVGLVVIAEEKIDDGGLPRVIAQLSSQPSWSELPLIVVGRLDTLGPSLRQLMDLTNVVLIERPVAIRTLLSVVIAEIKGRRRQYESRRAIAERSHFLAMIGHELRNPLAAISLGIAQLEASGSHPMVEMLRRQTTILEHLIDDLQQASRFNRGKMTFDVKRIDLGRVARRTVASFEERAAQKELHLQLDRCTADTLWVDADAVRLEQALGNLLSNAIRYTPKGGRIDVCLRRQDDTAVLSVCDTGLGIPKGMEERIFELFSTAHYEESRRKGGLGLGLSLVRSIVEEHGGKVVAHSDGEGKGSVFTLFLRVAKGC